MGGEGVIYRSQLFDPTENDLTFYLRKHLARYDETLKFHGVLSKIHHFSIGRKSQLQPPIKNLAFIAPIFFSESDAVLVARHDGILKQGLVLLLKWPSTFAKLNHPCETLPSCQIQQKTLCIQNFPLSNIGNWVNWIILALPT